MHRRTLETEADIGCQSSHILLRISFFFFFEKIHIFQVFMPRIPLKLETIIYYNIIIIQQLEMEIVSLLLEILFSFKKFEIKILTYPCVLRYVIFVSQAI